MCFFYGLKKTESLHSSKPPEGPGCYCVGDLYYSGSETSQPQISTFFEEMQLSSERKKNSLLLKDKVISSVLRANFSDQHDRLHLGLGAAQTYGERDGEMFSVQCVCDPARLVLVWQASSHPLELSAE